MENRVTDWGDSMRAALRALGRLIGSAILTMLGVLVVLFVGLFAGSIIHPLVGLLLGFLPAIYYLVRWATAPAAVVLENAGPAEALGRATRLVKNRWWPVFGVLAIAYIIQIVLTFIVGIVFGLVLAAAGFDDFSASTLALESFVGLLIGVVVQPFLPLVITVLYFDLRVRKEGFDLQVMADQLGRDLPSVPEPDQEWGRDYPDIPTPDEDWGGRDGPSPASPDDDPFG